MLPPEIAFYGLWSVPEVATHPSRFGDFELKSWLQQPRDRSEALRSHFSAILETDQKFSNFQKKYKSVFNGY